MKKYIVEVYDCGDKEWFLNDKRHREDGPAMELAAGDKLWLLNGKFHREDGPAVEYPSGEKRWYLHGELHREDGPAIEYPSGNKRWYLDGYRYTKEDWERKVVKLKKKASSSCHDKLVEIDGKKYKLVLVDD